MKKQILLAAVLGTMTSLPAFAGKSAAPNQGQPTGSVVTTTTIAAAIGSATSRSVVIVGTAPSGGVQVSVSAVTAGGAVISVPAVATLAGGTVTVTFSDGSSSSFSLAELGA